MKLEDEDFNFPGEASRSAVLMNSVHWKIPGDGPLDIAVVLPADPSPQIKSISQHSLIRTLNLGAVRIVQMHACKQRMAAAVEELQGNVFAHIRQ